MDFRTATTTFVKPEIKVKRAINQQVNDFPHLNKQSTGTTQPGLKSNHLLLIQSASTGPKERLNITIWKLDLTGLCCKTFGEFDNEICFVIASRLPVIRCSLKQHFPFAQNQKLKTDLNMDVRTEHEKTPKIKLPFNKTNSNYN